MRWDHWRTYHTKRAMSFWFESDMTIRNHKTNLIEDLIEDLIGSGTFRTFCCPATRL